ncbi:MAG: isochorismatase family protein [Chloroflexota bacterium]
MAERIWERFLSEQDRVDLATSSRRAIGFGERPALLLVDLYRWVFGDKPESLLEGKKSWPGTCGLAGWQALPHIQRLMAAAREAGIPVIHVSGTQVPGMLRWGEAAHNHRAASTDDPVMRERQSRRYDIIPEAAPLPGEVVLRKASPSAFWGTPLIGHLTNIRVDTLIVAGESTSGCVRATVVDGCSSRFRMIVVEECVFDRHEAAHAINLFDMDQKYADVLPLDEVLGWLRASKPAGAASAA